MNWDLEGPLYPLDPEVGLQSIDESIWICTARLPFKNAILAVPPPNSGAGGSVDTAKGIV